MLARSDVSPVEAAQMFSAFGVEAGFLVPTETGLTKGIMDAHAELRSFLALSCVHDYSSQKQGSGDKRVIRARHVAGEAVQEVDVSLYRPLTKQGDPRLWIYGLPKWARPGNLLAFFQVDRELYVVNVSDPKNALPGLIPQGALKATLESAKHAVSKPLSELLSRLGEIASRGWIQTLRPGPTGVGYTLETLLGIAANSRRDPDYKGIEIKAGRRRNFVRQAGPASDVRVSLFSKAPDWKQSPVRSARDLLERFGYERDGRLQLYCTLSAKGPNSLGHFLRVDDSSGRLYACYRIGNVSTETLLWPLVRLQRSLVEKHGETVWVAADSIGAGPQEQFRYSYVEYTRGPLASHLPLLLENGTVELDFTLSLVPNKSGGLRARDHGYLFKLWPQDRGALFPPPMVFTLLSDGG